MNIDGYCTLGVDREFDLTESALLELMDRAQVDRAVVASVDRCLAVHNMDGNDLVLHAASAHPDRLIPSCTANPWYGDAAVEEVKRAAGAGAPILVLHPLVQGYVADDELVWPVLDAALQEGLLVYAQTGPPGNATPWHLVDLAERYPGLDFVMVHCGATDLWNDVIHAGQAAANVHLMTCLTRPFSFTGYLDAVGDEKGLMGSYAPINDLTLEWEQMRKALPEGRREAVLGGNLLRLLAKRGAQ